MSKPDPASAVSKAALHFVLSRRGSRLECAMTGASMLPAMPEGSRVRLLVGTPDPPQPGAVVAVLLGGDTLSIHRLVHVGRSPRARGWALTTGDGNLICDVPVPLSQVVGVVEAWVAPGETAWRARCPEVSPEAVARGSGARFITSLFRWSLEIHPKLGLLVRDLMVLQRAAVVALRPYPESAKRSASRLATGAGRARDAGVHRPR